MCFSIRATRQFIQLVKVITFFGIAAASLDAWTMAEPPTEFEFLPVSELQEKRALPNPFMRPDGTLVKTVEQWEQQREYLKAMLIHYMYGQMPPRPKQLGVRLMYSQIAFEGAAVEEHYTLKISREGKSVDLAISLFRPVVQKRYPAIIKNCRVLFDPNEAPERFKAIVAEDLVAAGEAIDRGYLLCKFRREDLAADHPDNRNKGVFPLYPEYDWGTIAVWAWGHQVVLDALDQLGLANLDQIICTGHSRGGQTATAAGIFDERIDIVVPCTGGYGSCGTLRVRDPNGVRGKMDYFEQLKKVVPHWFSRRYLEFEGQQDKLPFDAHTLVALIAPRPFLNTNALEDEYNNTLSIEAGLRTGRLVYEWLQVEDRCRLHWRPGMHAQKKEDWWALFDFSDEFLFGRPHSRKFNEWVFPEFKPGFSNGEGAVKLR